MRDEKARLAADLREVLALGLRDLEDVRREAKAALASTSGRTPTPLETYGAAAVLQSFYTAVERVLERIALDLDQVTLQGADWHRRLLAAATLDKPGVRPALFDRSCEAALEEYLRFRHLFRNLYVFNLRWERVRALLEGVEALSAQIERHFKAFDRFLEQVAR